MGKKIIFTLSAAALLGVNLCAAGIASASNNVIQTKAEGSSSVVFDFEGNDPFKDWNISTDEGCTVQAKALNDLLSNSSETFWTDRNFYANGSKFLNMYNGDSNWKGTITSPSFTLGGDGYISALIGGGRNTTSYIDVVDADGNSVGHLSNAGFADPKRSENLSFNFIQLPERVGETLHLVIRQTNGTNDLAGLTIDDIAIGLTKEELKNRFTAEKDGVANGTDESAEGLKKLYNKIESTFDNDDHDIMNPGFETGTTYGWSALSNTPNMYASLSSSSTFWGDTKIPANSTGTWYWYSLDENTGLKEDEAYSVRSTSFTLEGSGYISYSIAGRVAAVEVRRVSDNATLAHFDNTAFKDVNFPYVLDGYGDGRLGTLTHFAADLSGYVGEKLYLVFLDQETGGNWGNLCFDDVVTYYPTKPDVDSLKDSGITNPNLDSTASGYNATYNNVTGSIAWKAATYSDSDQNAANEFMTYFKGLRTNGSICGVKNDSTKLNDLKTKYNALNDNAKTIVHASRDYGLTAEGGSTYAECTVLETLAMLGVVELPLNSAKGLPLSKNSSEELAITSIIVGASLLAVGSFAFVAKNRKRKKED